MQESSIISIVSTIKMNIRFFRASQFFLGFYFTVWHKLEKEYVVTDALSRLASANTNLLSNLDHSELDVLFAYTTILIQLKPVLF